MKVTKREKGVGVIGRTVLAADRAGNVISPVSRMERAGVTQSIK